MGLRPRGDDEVRIRKDLQSERSEEMREKSFVEYTGGWRQGCIIPFLGAQAALEQLSVCIVLQRHSVDLLRIGGRKIVESLGSLKSGIFAAYAWGRSLRSHSAQWLPQKEGWALTPGGDSRRMLLTQCRDLGVVRQGCSNSSSALAAKHLYY